MLTIRAYYISGFGWKCPSGGGGGVLFDGSGPTGGDGGWTIPYTGRGGSGYGAGGGAGGYDSNRQAGGAGAPGFVYVEWG